MPKAKRHVSRTPEQTIVLRCGDIMGLVTDGQPFRLIRQYVSENHARGLLNWDVDDRTLFRYIDRCTERFLATLPERDKKIIKGRHPRRLERLYARSAQQGNLRVALAVLQEQAKFYGFNPPDRHEVGGPGQTPLGATTAELAARFKEIVEDQARHLNRETSDDTGMRVTPEKSSGDSR